MESNIHVDKTGQDLEKSENQGPVVKPSSTTIEILNVLAERAENGDEFIAQSFCAVWKENDQFSYFYFMMIAGKIIKEHAIFEESSAADNLGKAEVFLLSKSLLNLFNSMVEAISVGDDEEIIDRFSLKSLFAMLTNTLMMSIQQSYKFAFEGRTTSSSMIFMTEVLKVLGELITIWLNVLGKVLLVPGIDYELEVKSLVTSVIWIVSRFDSVKPEKRKGYHMICMKFLGVF